MDILKCWIRGALLILVISGLSYFASLLLFPFALAAPALHDAIVIVLDGSGSMSEKMIDSRTGSTVYKIDAAKAALKDALVQVPANTQVGMIVFSNGESRWVTNPQVGPIQHGALVAQIDQVQASGGTPLGVSILAGTNGLMREREAQYGNGRYQLLVVTDGQATDGIVMERYAPMVPQRGIRLDVIGVDMPGGQTHKLAQWAHSYQSADDAVSLQAALKKAIRVEAGGDDRPVDFSATDGLSIDVARSWIAALAAPAPNYPLDGEPPRPASEGQTASTNAPEAAADSQVIQAAGCASEGEVVLAVIAVIVVLLVLAATFGLALNDD